MTEKNNRTVIEAEIRHHVAAEERAYRWVEKLALQSTMSRDEATIMLNEILLLHYNDIIEERSISMFCGYPLCASPIKKTGKQKYHISTKFNRVYEMAKVERFCSHHCRSASKYIENQIPDTPLWLRNKNNMKTIEFLEAGGNPIGHFNLDDESLPLAMERLKIEDIENIRSSRNEEGKDDDSEQDDGDDSLFDDQGSGGENKSKKDSKVAKRILLIRENLSKPPQDKEDLNKICDKLKAIMLEWVNQETYKLYKNRLKPNQTLNSDSKNTESRNERSTVLQGPEEEFRLKAFQFLAKNPEWANDSNIKSYSKGTPNEEKQNQEYIAPVVDSKAQNAIRRKIVRRKFHSQIDRLVPVLGLLHADLVDDGFYLIFETFRLTSQNIVLKPKEWTLVTVLLLKVFSSILPKVEEALSKKQTDLETFLIDQDICDVDLTNRITNELKREALYEEVECDTHVITDDEIDQNIFCSSVLENDTIENNREPFDMEELD